MVTEKHPDPADRTARLTIPELQQSKTAVLNTLVSIHSRRCCAENRWTSRASQGCLAVSPNRVRTASGLFRPVIDESDASRAFCGPLGNLRCAMEDPAPNVGPEFGAQIGQQVESDLRRTLRYAQ